MPGPLSGIRVLDLSIMVAGPWTGALLGQLGADVIKLEPPAGDGTRWVVPTQRGIGTNYIGANVNKRGVMLDLKDPEDKKTAVELAKHSDVLIQNFRTGALDKLDLGYEQLQRENPRLIYCSISGFGSSGPMAQDRCADFIMQAFSGFARLNGPRGATLEQFRQTAFIDLSTSAVACEAILAALIERDGSGQGQHVDVSMLEGALEVMHTRFAEYLIGGRLPVPNGSESSQLAPDRGFATLDREVFVTVHDDAQWSGFCQAVGLRDLARDERFATNQGRVAARLTLNELLEPIFAARPAIWWLRILERNNVPVGIAHHFEVLRHHVQVLANEMMAEVDSSLGRLLVGGVPWHFEASPCVVGPPPRPGEHTKQVLDELGRLQARQ